MQILQKSISLIAFSLILYFSISCQPKESETASTPVDVTELDLAYEKYQEKSITERRFKHADVIHLVKDRKGKFAVEEIGKSVEGKEIYQMTIGTGETKVMLWSQMHGNESTATMALFDLFNFFDGENDGLDELRNKLLEKLTIRFIPIVNPDGMDNWMRRNALDIDLNRDAAKLASPEAVILKNARDVFSPAFGFNLHDQQTYYTAGEVATPATISILAPAYNFETEINDVRKKAMQAIVGMTRMMDAVAPGHVGKYDDAFEPRAFGDNFQKWGTSTILIESGGYPNDPEKQYIRKLNFMIMLYAMEEIADQSFVNYSLDEYEAIPENATRLMDVMIRNLPMKKDSLSYPIDLGIRRREIDANGAFYVSGGIDDLGDLSIFYGYEELDASGMEIIEGKIYETVFEKVSDVSPEKALELLKAGYLAVKVKESEARELHGLPILVFKNATSIPFGIRTGGSPNFFLSKDGMLKYAIVNGYLIDLEKPIEENYRMSVN
ncbi:M14 family zinc carboxypeptidase [Cognataquiflexum rubidum]|uniref:M14 family zinc carboxypeptidase n=1 Tax=Cognataquiflexum rubidum TaxID=2922273 RepID=UPI001F1462DD|nr:M14 family zinc carboxypeptidase [Cognataquiflexum rubidum]MCH6233938.1 peptidase M14 [Cognataquiflexum rubidum]